MFSSSLAPNVQASRNIFGRARYPVLCFNWRGVEKIIILNSFRAAIAGGLAFIFAFTFLSAVGYMFWGDDLVKATLASQARMEQAYEDRLAAMRAQVDLVTSRQLLNQQAVEHRVSQLMARQQALSLRNEQASDVLSRAMTTGSLKQAKTLQPLTRNTPGNHQAKKQGLRLGSLSLNGAGSDATHGAVEIASADLRGNSELSANVELFDTLEQSLHETERAQMAELNQLRKEADNKARKIARILSKQGIKFPGQSGIGGPLIALKGSNQFSETVDALDASLNTLEKIRKAAKRLPHGSPVAGQPISSRFGGRRDPFTGKRAVHGGLDFKAKTGHVVRATGSGKVVKAGRLGGYGKLVEIDHGDGITTRYGHLSRIKVRVGQRISRGTKIGNVGSTGRSTGPHLHYEVRRKGRVLNPIHYVRLEKHLKPYL